MLPENKFRLALLKGLIGVSIFSAAVGIGVEGGIKYTKDAINDKAWQDKYRLLEDSLKQQLEDSLKQQLEDSNSSWEKAMKKALEDEDDKWAKESNERALSDRESITSLCTQEKALYKVLRAKGLPTYSGYEYLTGVSLEWTVQTINWCVELKKDKVKG